MAQNIYENQNPRIKESDFREQKFKSKSDSKNAEQEINAEADIGADYLHSFCAELLSDFRDRDYKSLTEEQKKILSPFPGDLEKSQNLIEQLQKQEKEDKEEELQDELDDNSKDKNLKNKRSAKREQRKIERQAKLREVSGELFIAACASTKSVEDSLKFHKKCNLGVEELNKFNKNGISPLVAVMASGKDAKELDKLLKTSGVDVNFKDKNGNSALHNAAAMGLDKKFLEVLIENGANVNAKNDLGMTAFDVAAIKGDEKAAELLLKNGGKSGLAEKINNLDEEKQSAEAKLPKDQKMQEMLKKIKESAERQKEGSEKEEQRQLKKEPKKNSSELVSQEKEKLRQEKIRQERAKQEEFKARMNAEIDLAFKMHQERLEKLAKENAVKKTNSLQKEQEQYDLEFAEKQRIELEKWNLQKANIEKQVAESYLQEQALLESKIQQNNAKQQQDLPIVISQTAASEENLSKKEEREFSNQVNLESIFRLLQVNQAQEEQTYKSLLTRDDIVIIAPKEIEKAFVLQEQEITQNQLPKISETESVILDVKPASPIEEILGFKLSEVTAETINKMLFEAVRKNQTMLSNLLILCGADVNHREGGVTILEVAQASGNQSLESIIKTKVSETGVVVLQKDITLEESEKIFYSNNAQGKSNTQKTIDLKEEFFKDFTTAKSSPDILQEVLKSEIHTTINSKEQKMTLEIPRPNPVVSLIKRSVEALKPVQEYVESHHDVPGTVVKAFKHLASALAAPKVSEFNHEEEMGSSIASLSVRISGSVLHDPKNLVEQNISELENLSSKGNLESTLKLGIIYLSSPANIKEEEKGLELLQDDRLKSDVEAQKALGEFYYNKSSRDLVFENLRESVKWFEKAAQQGDQSALHNLGAIHYACYAKGLAFDGDRESHYEKAKEIFGVLQDKKLAAKEIGRLESAKEFITDGQLKKSHAVTHVR